MLGIDDANIYFVYMKNLANGYGFVWNVGDEKVEGFTSLFWTLIGAGIYKISPANFAYLLAALLFGFTFLTINISLGLIRKLNKSVSTISFEDIIVLSFLLLPLGFVEWNVLSLMETGLWTFLLTSMVVLLCNIYMNGRDINRFILLGLIIAINLTRPESILIKFVFILILLSINVNVKGWKKALYRSFLPLSVHLATIAVIIKWRLSYFGYAFPNTYYAKVSHSIKDNAVAGFNYAFIFFYNYPINVFILMMLLFFSGKILVKVKDRTTLAIQEKVHLILTAFILVALAMPMLTGGDHFKYNRFYQMLLPVFFLAICNKYCWDHYIKISISSSRLSQAFMVVAFLGTLFLSAKYTIFDFVASQRRILHYPVIQDFIVSKSGRDVAEKMNQTFSSLKTYPSVGTLATGGFAFIYKGKTIDLMGLNNTRMAHATSVKIGYRNHASFNKNVFYTLQPDMMGTFYGADVIKDTMGFVLPENTPAFRTDYANMVYGGFKEIYDDERFRDIYSPVLLNKPGEDFFIFDYCSKDFLLFLKTTDISVTSLKRNSLSDKFLHPEEEKNFKLSMKQTPE
jgi:arabinofuranosyltransferase